jgi:tRNA (guanine-N7-)-methyltransferase
MDETQFAPYRPRINSTRQIPNPNIYICALEGEFNRYAFNEERAPLNKGKWRTEIAKSLPQNMFSETICTESHLVNSPISLNDIPLDVEFGTGNGHHFAHHAADNPNRMLVGFELKYKPLIQSIRRALSLKAQNARILRYHAHNIDLVFEQNEINNVYIHFPDPWERPRKFKNRIVCETFLNRLYELQRTDSFIEFKTDSRAYFLWAMKEIRRTPYKIEFETLDLHSTPLKDSNFITTFERIFIRQNIPINYVKLRK